MSGRVVVVAGEHPLLPALCERLGAAGALVAFVAHAAQPGDGATLSFRADPGDAEVWQRIGMHIEQQLGPVDAVAADESCAPTVRDVFGPDLHRRGHGGLVQVAADDSAEDVLSRLADTQ
jgi:hypothetical protein